MLQQIDRCNGFIIHKVVTPNGRVLGFQTVPEGQNGADVVSRFPNLTAARKAVGFGLGFTTKKVELTKPKSEYPQNQPGYRADSQRAKK